MQGKPPPALRPGGPAGREADIPRRPLKRCDPRHCHAVEKRAGKDGFPFRVPVIHQPTLFPFQRHCERSAFSCFQKAQLKSANTGDNEQIIGLLTRQLTRTLPPTSAGRRQKQRQVRLAFEASFTCTG